MKHTLSVLVQNGSLRIGDPIVDISAEIEEKCIQQFGLEWGRTVMADEKNIGIFDVLERKAEVSYIPGGSVQNTMRVISWCMNLDEESKSQFTQEANLLLNFYNNNY